MTQEEALLSLAQETASAIIAWIEEVAPGSASLGEASRFSDDASPFDDLQLPVVASQVSYIDGASGGTMVLLPPEAVSALAAAMMGMDPDEADGTVGELELSALGEAMNQMMARAAAASSEVLGIEVDITPPQTAMCEQIADVAALYNPAAHSIVVSATAFGSDFRFIQIVPHSFLVRLAAALSESNVEKIELGAQEVGDRIPASVIDEIPLACAIELGRAILPAYVVNNLRSGEVVPLDQQDDAPLLMRVSGNAYARGRLTAAPTGELEYEIVEMLAPSPGTYVHSV